MDHSREFGKVDEVGSDDKSDKGGDHGKAMGYGGRRRPRAMLGRAMAVEKKEV